MSSTSVWRSSTASNTRDPVGIERLGCEHAARVPARDVAADTERRERAAVGGRALDVDVLAGLDDFEEERLGEQTGDGLVEADSGEGALDTGRGHADARETTEDPAESAFTRRRPARVVFGPVRLAVVAHRVLLALVPDVPRRLGGGDEVTALAEPGVEVDDPVVLVDAVVRDQENGAVVASEVTQPLHAGVDPAVDAGDGVPVRAVGVEDRVGCLELHHHERPVVLARESLGDGHPRVDEAFVLPDAAFSRTRVAAVDGVVVDAQRFEAPFFTVDHHGGALGREVAGNERAIERVERVRHRNVHHDGGEPPRRQRLPQEGDADVGGVHQSR
jgi:hypothetical protein